MRTVAVIGRFPPPIDGQTLATRRLAELLHKNHRVIAADTSYPEPHFVQTEVRFRPDRIRHYVRTLPALKRALKAAPEAPVLWTSVSPVALGHWRDVLTTLPAFQPDQQVFAVLHRRGFQHLFESRLTAASARRLVRRVRGFVFLNDQLADECARYIPAEKRIIIPNTIDDKALCTDEEVAEKQQRRKARPTLRLLFLSNMLRGKGYFDVLVAADLLRRRGRDFVVDFAGRWPSDLDRTEFERYVAEHGLESVVRHHGSVSEREQVRRLHYEADVFLLPSYYPAEAQPLAILEALNAGTPIVTTNHGGIPNIVNDGRQALFVPLQNPEAVADAVESLFDYTRWKHYSDEARTRFESLFSPDTVRRQWEELITTV